MANSYLNILTFLLTTLLYYFIKPTLTYDVVADQNLYMGFVSDHHLYLGIYLLLVLVVQFIVNTSIISTTCGGSVKENMGAAGLLTFIPWLLIFGVIIIVLIIYPGFKSAFSDVIGYFYVSNKANEILVELLANQGVENALNKGPENALNSTTPVATPVATPITTLVGGGPTEMRAAADLILKICGNTSILINQIVPSNFNSYWQLLNPLKKEKYQDDNSVETRTLKTQLFDLVVTRDNIGELLWYIYTGILLTSIVQLKITTRGCASNPKTMEANYKQFQEQEAAAQQQVATATSTTYTITN